MKKDYREKTIKGMFYDRGKLKPDNVTVRMTSDDIGQSLSLQTADTMIQIPLEQVAGIIKIAEKE